MYRIVCVGDICPLPVIKTKQYLESELGEDFESFQIEVDNDVAVENISKFLENRGCDFTVHGRVIRVDSPGGSSGEAGQDFIIVIDSQYMGAGDDVLGASLIKGFIFAVSQLDTLPTRMIFYNTGAKLTVANSPVLQDLRGLAQNGVKILTCGACLNYFNITQQVGDVTDMYTILNLMATATKVVKP